MQSKVVIFAIFLIISCALLIYSNTLYNPFIFDDIHLVKDNIYIKNWSNIGKIFSENTGAGFGGAYSTYRPLQIFSYLIDYSIWGLDPRGYHLTSILLHALVAICIYWMINLLFKDKIIAFLTSILFVVHPIHNSTVTYISSRTDLLAVLFFLLSFIFYIKGYFQKSLSKYILMFFSYILALLSKECSLILPVLLLIYHYTFKIKINYRCFLSLIGISIIYILFRIAVLNAYLPHTVVSTTLLERMPGFFVAITNYFKLLLLPLGLHILYGLKLFQFTDIKAIFGILILISLLVCSFWKQNSNKVAFFSIVWFFITLLPFSNLYPINAYMAEHWLYLPSIGFFLILSKWIVGLYRSGKFRFFTLFLIIGLVAFYSFQTNKQNTYWQDPIIFYSWNLKYEPGDTRLHDNLGNALKDAGRTEEAIIEFKKAIAIEPNNASAHHNLAFAYQSLGNVEKAIASYEKALLIKADDTKFTSLVLNNLGTLYNSIGDTEKAINLCRKSIEANSYFVTPYYNLGIIYYNKERIEESIDMFQKTIALNPGHFSARNNLGLLYVDMGRLNEGIALFQKAVDINPYYIRGYINLGNTYRKMGNINKAIESYKKVVTIKDDYGVAHNTLAELYYEVKQYNLAIKHCDKAIELDYKVQPDFLKLLKPYRK